MAEITDVSTTLGALKRVWFRYRYFFLVIFGVVASLFALSQILTFPSIQSPLAAEELIPTSRFIVSGSKLMYHGDPSKFESRYFDKFPDLPFSPTNLDTRSPQIDTIEIKWVRLHGPTFTSQLGPYAPTLKSLRLDNVTIESHLVHINLPALQEFFLNQGAQPEESSAPDYLLHNGPTLWLLSTLFFVDDSSDDFATKAVLAYSKSINVTVYLKGSIAYQLNPGSNEIRLDISDCHQVLAKLPKTYKILTLGRCKDLTPNSINSGITFLNLYIVYVSNSMLSEILRNLKNLEEFYVEIPDGPIDIKLQDLSPKLKILSVSSMKIIPGKSSYPNIKEFYFGQENQYGWLESRITTLNDSFFLMFSRIFPKAEKVGLFDLKDEERYIFLQSVLQSPSLKWILVENFGRGENADVGISVNAYLSVENYLDQLGVSKSIVDFVIETDNSTGKRVASEVTPLEKLWFRFTYLGWSQIDLYGKFLYVQKIIAAGGILGEGRSKQMNIKT